MNDVLGQLRDIHVPEAVSWWPPALGYWLIFLLIISVVAAWLLQKRRYRVRAAALEEFELLVSKYHKQDQKQQLAQEISVLLRRIALTFSAREQVAGVTGQNWIDVLEKLSPRAKTRFSDTTKEILSEIIYRSSDDFDVAPLITECRHWISALPAVGGRT